MVKGTACIMEAFPPVPDLPSAIPSVELALRTQQRLQQKCCKPLALKIVGQKEITKSWRPSYRQADRHVAKAFHLDGPKPVT